ncbi:MAG: hypothetical protein N2482_01715 [Patescibacteria group bacterium]|nr:hypothetical protein [Patescibacteria group bacterium]
MKTNRETMIEYLERRKDVLSRTAWFAQELSTVFVKLPLTLTANERTDRFMVGLGRPYNAVINHYQGKTKEGNPYQVTHTSFLQSPQQRAANGFTDPLYQIEFTDDENPQISLKVMVMGNREIKVMGKTGDTPDKICEFNSWELETVPDLLENLSNPILEIVFEKFGMRLEVNQNTWTLEETIKIGIF